MRRMRGRQGRRHGVVVIAVVIAMCAVVVTGCASSNASSERSVPEPVPVPAADQAVLRKAEAATRAAGDASVSTSVTMTGLDPKQLPGLYNLAGDGRVDFKSGDSALTISMPYLDELTGGGSKVEQRIVDDMSYLKLPAALLRSAGAGPQTQWVARDVQVEGATDLSALAQAQSDPARQLARLAKVRGKVEGIGKESVRGVMTTHFRGTADASGTSVPVEAWIDADGLVRRMIVTLPLARLLTGSELSEDATLRVQQDLYDFGSAAAVTAPPTGRVTPADSITLSVKKP
jgi:hypothetical protein